MAEISAEAKAPGSSTEPGAQEYFIARLTLEVGGQPLRVVDEWSERFTRLRDAARYDECRRLLHGAKSWTTLPSYGWGVVLYAEGWLYDRLGETAQALRAYRRADRAFADAGLAGLRSTLLTQIGSLLQELGDHEGARTAYEDALSRANGPAEEAAALINSGGLALVLPDAEAAEAHFREALARLDGADARNTAVARHGLGNSLELQNRLPEAQQEFVAAFKSFQDLKDAYGVASSAASLGVLEITHGSPATAIELLTLSLATFQALQDTRRVAATLNNLGIANSVAGNYEEAVHHWRQARAVHRELGDDSAAEAVEKRIENVVSMLPPDRSACVSGFRTEDLST